ncbi:hypothetical protein VOLCADRAFT_105733 [Volvox carteri f. nagariensis]|uniref:Uncharacterized protein n=1 Tax=Volvox carteri f. nagariensis TaxID=3068 RepID=D8U2P7_VOLCA|nr:uncharacterized protein VOLCADRAFT_105733 [Volvox carteri f. nagariensis]EFJ45936.1 hypothetical protein VOLCADRAFT_105733 [Volvox carteri f. nagariensis]|eukprot:XP_002953014.1 hypothetical protein VOLCADRAFT_105733 [Volvox carteri f. nagariensis]
MSRSNTMERYHLSAFKLPSSFFKYDALSTVLSTADDALLLAAGAWQNISGMLCNTGHRYPSEADDNVVISESNGEVMELASWWASIRALDGKGQLAAMALMYDAWHGLYDSSPVIPVAANAPGQNCISRASTTEHNAFETVAVYDKTEGDADAVVISTGTPFYTSFADLDFSATKHQELQPPYHQQALISARASLGEIIEAGSDCLVTIASGVAMPTDGGVGDGAAAAAGSVVAAVVDWPSLELIVPALDSVALTAALCSFDDGDGAEEDFFWVTPAFGVANGSSEKDDPRSPEFVPGIVNAGILDVDASFDASVDASTACATASDACLYDSDLDSDSTVDADGYLLASGGDLSSSVAADLEFISSSEDGLPMLKLSLSPSHSMPSEVEVKPSRRLDCYLQRLATKVPAPSLLPPPPSPAPVMASAPVPARDDVDELKPCVTPVSVGRRRNCATATLAQRRLESKWQELQVQWLEFDVYWQQRTQSRRSPRPPKPQEPQPAQVLPHPQRRGDLKPQPQQQRLWPQSKLPQSPRAASSPQQQQQQRTVAGAGGGGSGSSRPNFMRSTTASALMATTRSPSSPFGQHQASRQHSAGSPRMGAWSSSSSSSNNNIRRV